MRRAGGLVVEGDSHPQDHDSLPSSLPQPISESAASAHSSRARLLLLSAHNQSPSLKSWHQSESQGQATASPSQNRVSPEPIFTNPYQQTRTKSIQIFGMSCPNMFRSGHSWMPISLQCVGFHQSPRRKQCNCLVFHVLANPGHIYLSCVWSSIAGLYQVSLSWHSIWLAYFVQNNARGRLRNSIDLREV